MCAKVWVHLCVHVRVHVCVGVYTALEFENG